MGLIAWLTRKQTELAMLDTHFARELGIDPTYWARMKSGERRATLRLMRAAMNRWPESEIEICRAARIEEPTAA